MKKLHFTVIILLFLSSCATYKTKYVDYKSATALKNNIDQQIEHTFYLIGDAGKSPIGGMNPVLQAFAKRLETATKNSTVLFLGDNIYPSGLPKKNAVNGAYAIAKSHLDAQLKTLENYKGRPIFIPGNHDWYADGPKGVQREQKYIENALDQKNVFLPKDGCPLRKEDVGPNTVVIAVDTEWYLANWNAHPTINDECEIKDREKFFEELEGLIKKNATKTTIIALHHPMFTYGPHSGQYSFKQHFNPSSSFKVPLPILGTLANVLRRTGGVSKEDQTNKHYTELRKRVVTMAQYSEKVVLVSGHEHTLQYIVEENTPQIVSGSGAKKGVSRLLNGSRYSTGHRGYAELVVFKDGSSEVRFFEVDDQGVEQLAYSDKVLKANPENTAQRYDEQFPKEVQASIYTQEEIEKSGFYRWLWGERYRNYYGSKITAPTARLDTLFGGLVPVRKGGGHQSRSLRLRDKEGREYVMRALRKSAELYLQTIAFKDQYVLGDFEGTAAESLLQDFYTGSYPYAPLAIGPLADAVGVYHTNPKLFYIPKQKALENFNEDFGDELYILEERADSGHGRLKSFGNSNTIVSTDDLFKKLRKDEKYSLDVEAYAKARLFDLMIGDWDRHFDQWRWAEFEDKKTGKVTFKPVPRDRDQAFSILGDGFIMGFASRRIPPAKIFEGFNEKIRNLSGFTSNPRLYSLDLALLSELDSSTWEAQAKYIQESITEETINQTFSTLPKEVQDETLVDFKRILLSRKEDLVNTARNYHSIINRFALITGTDKDDYFTITTKPNGFTEVVGNRIKNGKLADVFYKKTFNSKETKELWIYGLDDDDVFEVIGEGNGIVIRLVGGQNNDTYKVNDNRQVHVYDFKAKKNNYEGLAKGHLHNRNDYETNTFQFEENKKSGNQLRPLIGFNPDDGVLFGFSNTYTYNGFIKKPFTARHTIRGAFYFATNGFDLGYNGEFAHIFGTTNLELEGVFTSPNFSVNFFGFGNNTENVDDEEGLNFNRVKLQTLRFAPSFSWRGVGGAKYRLGLSFEDIEAELTPGRFIEAFVQDLGDTDTKDGFVGIDGEYSFENKDGKAFTSLGLAANLLVGYKTNTDDFINSSFGYIIPELSFDYPLSSNRRLVLATKFKGHINIGNDFEFYQAASIGGLDGLRGFRNQRFTGKYSYYQNTDIRYSFRKTRTGILPVNFGIFGGFDYGRVWLAQDDTAIWNTSAGGGFFVNGANTINLNAGLFGSEDGARFTFGLGFGF